MQKNWNDYFLGGDGGWSGGGTGTLMPCLLVSPGDFDGDVGLLGGGGGTNFPSETISGLLLIVCSR